MIDIDGAWQSIRAKAGLHDVRIHDIRHSFASRAHAFGKELPIIGRQLGHRKVETTVRYVHLARDSMRESAERIPASIAADILWGFCSKPTTIPANAKVRLQSHVLSHPPE